MDRDIKLQDLHLLCRACLCELSECKHDVSGMTRSLLKLFKKCANLRKTQSELYPKSICGQCFDSLKHFDDFQEKTKTSTNFLIGLLKSYKAEAGELETNEPYESSAESEASLQKLENFQSSDDDCYKAADDPLQWAENQVEISKRKEIEANVLKQKQENDFESVLVKMEEKEPEEVFNLEKESQNMNRTEDIQSSESDTDKLAVVSKKLKKDIKCMVCEEVLTSAKALRNHMQTEHDQKPVFKCKECDQGFDRKSRLILHRREVHAANPVKIICKYGCGKNFRRSRTADNHYRLKHSTPTPDDITDKTSLNETATLKVQSSETLLSPKIEDSDGNKSDDEALVPFNKEVEKLPKLKKKMCTICFGMFSNNTALRKHLNTHQDVRPFQCDKCERGFNCKSRLQKHMRELHSENPVEFVCKFGCGKVFKTSDSAGNHYRRQHSGKVIKSEEATCICEDCGRVFKCMTRLKQHSYQHRPVEERPYHCEVCNKRFVFKKTYNEHLLRHKGIKEFECPQCGLKKTTKQELRNHMKYHTDELKVPCPLCKKIFGNAPNLRRHIQLVHEGVKNFKCRFCDEAFGKAETLKHHEMRHTGEKPHKCEICDKSFIQLVALRTHMKTHNKLPKMPKVNRGAEVAVYEQTALMDISENTM